MEIPSSGCGNVRSGARGGGDICPPPLEHLHPVYPNLFDTGDMYGIGMETGSTGITPLVGSGRNRLRTRGREDSGAGGAGYGGRDR